MARACTPGVSAGEAAEAAKAAKAAKAAAAKAAADAKAAAGAQAAADADAAAFGKAAADAKATANKSMLDDGDGGIDCDGDAIGNGSGQAPGMTTRSAGKRPEAPAGDTDTAVPTKRAKP
jgi:colicin import membrane protein